MREEGFRVNHKRIYRLWREEGLKVARKVVKKRRLGMKENGCSRRVASAPNEVWAYDFVHDRTVDGRALKALVVMDEFTRECLSVQVSRGITGARVVEVLAGLMERHGAPKHLRSDNGPEFVSKRVRSWLAGRGVRTLFIEPGAPWQNGFVESLNGKLGDEVLKRELFGSLLEARVVIEDWRRHYNEKRPHSALGFQTPSAFGRLERERFMQAEFLLPPRGEQPTPGLS